MTHAQSGAKSNQISRVLTTDAATVLRCLVDPN